MRKLLIGVILVALFFCSDVWAGDSLLVAVRKAKDKIGTTDIADSVWTSWANDGYQACLTDGFAYLKQATIVVTPYAYPDSDNYVLPSDFYAWYGAKVVTPSRTEQNNIKLLIFGQEEEIGLGRAGFLDFCTINDDSIQFFPNPAQDDTVLLYYYSDDATLTDSVTMKIPRAYTALIANYILSEYFDRMQNSRESDRYMTKFSFQLDKKTQLRRAIKADYIITQKPVDR